jgi:uncharacterized protein YhfF
MNWQDLETFSFGDGPDLANRLLELVLAGTKRATCWAESQGLLSAEVGKLMVVLDGQGAPKAVLKTIELTKRRFDEVDEAFAYDEGEGDRSLQYWREAHTRYFTRLGRYAPDMMLWCERFDLSSALARPHPQWLDRKPLTSEIGTFGTCGPKPRTSTYRGRSEVTGPGSERRD